MVRWAMALMPPARRRSTTSSASGSLATEVTIFSESGIRVEPTPVELSMWAPPGRRGAVIAHVEFEILGREMSEEPTTPDLVELARRIVELSGKRDLDAIMAFYTPDVVWDASPMGIGTFDGHAAVRGLWEDWLSSYEDWKLQTVEVEDLGNGVTFGVLVQRGRLVGSSGELELCYAAVSEWEDGKIARIKNYTDIDEARADAERLALER